jgi:predicted Zn finger-like uncharacterized protein
MPARLSTKRTPSNYWQNRSSGLDTLLARTSGVIITCKDCQSQYEVADEKVQGRSARIRCRACGCRIFLSLDATTPPPARSTRHAMAPPRDDSADATAPRAALASPIDDQPATGGRHETSVLFTLAALTGFKSSKSAAQKKEDSGLIDLNALSTSGLELTPRNVKAPVLSEPPLGAFTTSVRYTPPVHTRRAQLYGAGIAAVALLAMIGLGFGMRGEKIESADVLAAAAPAVHAVAIEPAVMAVPAPVAPTPEVVASTVSDSKPAAPSKGKAKKGGKRAGGVKSSGPKKSAATSARASK